MQMLITTLGIKGRNCCTQKQICLCRTSYSDVAAHCGLADCLNDVCGALLSPHNNIRAILAFFFPLNFDQSQPIVRDLQRIIMNNYPLVWGSISKESSFLICEATGQQVYILNLFNICDGKTKFDWATDISGSGLKLLSWLLLLFLLCHFRRCGRRMAPFCPSQVNLGITTEINWWRT